MRDLPLLFADSQPHNSDFQVTRFAIAANGGTPFGCYMQTLRDLRTSFDALTSYHFEIEKLRLDLEEQEDRFHDDDEKPTLDERRARLEAARIRARIGAIEHHAADQVRIFGRLLALGRAYKRMVGDLTPERRAESEADLWEHRVKATIAADLMSGQPALSRSTLEMIAALPVEMKSRIWQKSASQQEQVALVEWWRTFTPTVPDVEPVPPEEVKRILCPSPSLPLTLA